MSVHTRTRPIKIRPDEDSIPWREVYAKEIKKYGEAGLCLRGSRHKLDMTQKELAKKLHISQHHISEMENGKRPIGKKMAKRFAKIFDVDYRVYL